MQHFKFVNWRIRFLMSRTGYLRINHKMYIISQKHVYFCTSVVAYDSLLERWCDGNLRPSTTISTNHKQLSFHNCAALYKWKYIKTIFRWCQLLFWPEFPEKRRKADVCNQGRCHLNIWRTPVEIKNQMAAEL